MTLGQYCPGSCLHRVSYVGQRWELQTPKTSFQFPSHLQINRITLGKWVGPSKL